MRPAGHVKVRISNMEAMVLAFLVEKDISFSTVVKSIILKIVDSARMLHSEPNIRVIV